MVQHNAIDHTGLTGVSTVSYASNANSVATANAGGAASTVTRGDHVHLGVRSIAHTSNTFSGPVILTASGTLGITSPAVGTYNLSATGGAGAASSGPTISNAIVATDETLTGNSTWVDLATAGPAVTATVGASGIVKVTITCRAYNTTSVSYNDMGFALSGANTVAAGTANKIIRAGNLTSASGQDFILSATFLLTGLAAGSTTFTTKYNQQGGPGTSHWANREIIVEVY